jgi:GntR family transcriptional regulator
VPEIQEVRPKYLQIAGYIRDQIVRGDLRPGDEVQSERELAAAWRVARPHRGACAGIVADAGLGRVTSRFWHICSASERGAACT